MQRKLGLVVSLVMAGMLLFYGVSLAGYCTDHGASDGCITTDDIKNKHVRRADIQNGAVGSAKIADGGVKTQDLADGAVTLGKMLGDHLIMGDTDPPVTLLPGVWTTSAGIGIVAPPTYDLECVVMANYRVFLLQTQLLWVALWDEADAGPALVTEPSNFHTHTLGNHWDSSMIMQSFFVDRGTNKTIYLNGINSAGPGTNITGFETNLITAVCKAQ